MKKSSQIKAKDKTKYLLYLKNEGILEKMYQLGIISPVVFKGLEARLKVGQLKRQGMRPGPAVKRVATMLGCHPKHIYTYLR